MENFYSTFCETYTEHDKHIELVSSSARKLKIILDDVGYFHESELSFLKKRLLGMLLYEISRINEQIAEALKSGSDTVAEALSRIQIEFCINCIYVLDINDDSRVRSLVVSYISTSKNKAKRWLRWAEKEESVDHQSSAIALKQHIENMEATFLRDWDLDAVEKWPSIYDRFTSIGHEGIYCTVYASASNSVHSLSEDFFNYLYYTSLEVHTNQNHLKGYFVEKKSFAIYLSLNATGFLCELIQKIVELSKKDIEQNLFSEVVKKLNEALIEHDRDHAQFNS